MQPKDLKYLLDIQSIISEIEYVRKTYSTIEKFKEDFLAVRAVERHLTIIGEALNNLKKSNSSIQVSHVSEIIGLRNLLVHSYDSIDFRVLWSIIQTDVPVLKREVNSLINS